MHGFLDSLRRSNSAEKSAVLPYIYVALFSARAVEVAHNPDISTIACFFSPVLSSHPRHGKEASAGVKINCQSISESINTCGTGGQEESRTYRYLQNR